LLVILSVAACKSKKNIAVTNSETQPVISVNPAIPLIKNINENKNTITFLSARSETAYKSGEQEYTFDAELMIEKDRYIWMNITALLGIQVARVMITPDSIRVLDYLNRTYISAGYGFMKTFTEIPLNYEQLQNLF